MKVLDFPKRKPAPELRVAPPEPKVVAERRPKRRIVIKLGPEHVVYYL